MPEFKPVGKGFTLVRAGEVNDRGGAAVNSTAAAGGKIVCRGGACYVQIKVRVGINEAGEKITALDIYHRSAFCCAHMTDFFDFLAVYQDISPPRSLGGDDKAAAKHGFHSIHSFA